MEYHFEPRGRIQSLVEETLGPGYSGKPFKELKLKITKDDLNRARIDYGVSSYSMLSLPYNAGILVQVSFIPSEIGLFGISYNTLENKLSELREAVDYNGGVVVAKDYYMQFEIPLDVNDKDANKGLLNIVSGLGRFLAPLYKAVMKNKLNAYGLPYKMDSIERGVIQIQLPKVREKPAFKLGPSGNKKILSENEQEEIRGKMKKILDNPEFLEPRDKLYSRELLIDIIMKELDARLLYFADWAFDNLTKK